MKLSPHFSLYEFTRTSYVEHLDENRDVSRTQIAKLTALSRYILEPIRSVLGKPLQVSSGYRCPALNKAVGGAKHSQHMLCEAADIVPKGLSTDVAFERIVQSLKDGVISLDYGQLIIETNKSKWIHVSLGFPYRERNRCCEVLSVTKEGNRATAYSILPSGVLDMQ